MNKKKKYEYEKIEEITGNNLNINKLINQN